MSTSSLILTVLAFSAPLAVVAGYIPFTISFGGVAATLVFAIVTALLLLFAIGYVAMTKSLPESGSFYTFISSGLGKIAGLGSAYLAVVSYLLMLGGCFVFIGLTAASFSAIVGLPSLPWWAWAILSWVLVSTLCYFRIDLSAKVLFVAMLIEVGIVVLFDAAALFSGGGPEGFSAAPLDPTDLASGDVGIAMLFAVMVFLGFESTALYRDEVRRPARTIPRATYGAVLFVGALYTASCYMLTAFYGSNAVEVASDNPKGMLPDAIGHVVAPMFTQITFFFVITSEIAAAIAVHNVTSRYIYNLASDSAVPTYLAQVHQRHGSPSRASNAVAVVVGALLIPLSLTNLSGEGLDAQLFGLGTVGVLVLMSLVSIAVIVWFLRPRARGTGGWFRTAVAPGLATITLVTIIVLAVQHFDLVVGGQPGQNLGLLIVLALSLAAGAGVALYSRARRPAKYAGLGRADTTSEAKLTVEDPASS